MTIKKFIDSLFYGEQVARQIGLNDKERKAYQENLRLIRASDLPSLEEDQAIAMLNASLMEQQTIGAQAKSEVTTAEVIEQIHHEFFTAGDRMLSDAQTLLETTDQALIDKVERLEKLGFGNASEVTKAKSDLKKAKLARENAELVTYYRQYYPLFKFITQAEIERINQKYNLVLGPISRYKGFVPERNLANIERAMKVPILACDIVYNCRLVTSDSSRFSSSSIGVSDVLLTHEELRVHYPQAYQKYFFANLHDQELIRRLVEGESAFSRNLYGEKDGVHCTILRRETDVLEICAPIKDMETTGMYLDKTTLKHYPDPIVLRPVRGGKLILDAWGNEASDPAVVNPTMN